MSAIYKFYMKKNSSPNIKKPEIIAIDGQNMQELVGRSVIKISKISAEERKFDFFEVVIDADNLSIKSIRGFEGEFKPELIKFANEVNTVTLQDLQEKEKNNDPNTNCLSLEQIQDIMDTTKLYGSDFLKKLVALLEEFPIKVEMAKVKEEDEAAFQRKVSKI